MDLVLVGLPGSGKSAVGRRIASRHGATFVDLDEQIEHASGRKIPEIFATDGEAAFRRLERDAVVGARPARRGPGAAARDLAGRRGDRRPAQPLVAVPRPAPRLARRPPRGPRPAAPSVAQRAAAGPGRRSRGPDPRSWRPLASASTRPRTGSTAWPSWRASIEAVDRPRRGRASRRRRRSCTRRRRSARSCSARGSPSRPSAAMPPAARGAAGGAGLRARRLGGVRRRRRRGAARGRAGRSSTSCSPQGEAAKQLAVVGEAARELARLRVERRDPLVAIGGGALGDPAGSSRRRTCAACRGSRSRRRSSPRSTRRSAARPASTCRRARTSSAPSTSPSAIVLDIAALRSAPRAPAAGGAGRDREDGRARRRGAVRDARGRRRGGRPRATPRRSSRAPLAEVVERPAWAKVEVVTADEREHGAAGGRITLNLGHTVAHALEAVDGYATLLHGEAVGVRAAGRRRAIGVAVGVTPADRAARIEAAPRRRSASASTRSPTATDAVLEATGTDKKHAAGRLRWVLPTADGVVVRDDVPDDGRRGGDRRVVAGAPGGGRGGRGMTRVLVLAGAEPEPARDARAGDLRPREPRRDPRRDRDARRGARARGRLLPVEPRGRAHRPPAPAELRRRDRQRRRPDAHVDLAARRPARRPAAVLGGPPVGPVDARALPPRELPPRHRAGVGRRPGGARLSRRARGDRGAVRRRGVSRPPTRRATARGRRHADAGRARRGGPGAVADPRRDRRARPPDRRPAQRARGAGPFGRTGEAARGPAGDPRSGARARGAAAGGDGQRGADRAGRPAVDLPADRRRRPGASRRATGTTTGGTATADEAAPDSEAGPPDDGGSLFVPAGDGPRGRTRGCCLPPR